MSRAVIDQAPARLLYRLADTLSLIDDECLANYRVLHASTPFDDPRYEVYASIIADLERVGASLRDAARSSSEPSVTTDAMTQRFFDLVAERSRAHAELDALGVVPSSRYGAKVPPLDERIRSLRSTRSPESARPATSEQVRCIHGGFFPCPQCKANRKWNEGAGVMLTEAEFERRYAQPTCDTADESAAPKAIGASRLRQDCTSCGVQMFSAERGDGSFVCKNDNCERYGDVVFPTTEGGA